MAERLGKNGKYGILLYDNLKGYYHIAIFNIRNDAEQIYTACRKLLNLYNSKSITDMVYYEEQNTLLNKANAFAEEIYGRDLPQGDIMRNVVYSINENGMVRRVQTDIRLINKKDSIEV